MQIYGNLDTVFLDSALFGLVSFIMTPVFFHRIHQKKDLNGTI